MYISFTTSYSRVLIINNFKVLILAFLNKGNSNSFIINNSLIKLKIIGKSKAFALLNYKLNLL
jgi:hypothetical protein